MSVLYENLRAWSFLSFSLSHTPNRITLPIFYKDTEKVGMLRLRLPPVAIGLDEVDQVGDGISGRDGSLHFFLSFV